MNVSRIVVLFSSFLRRSLKTSDHKLCHLFWSKTIDALRTHVYERDTSKLLRLANRYMYFNNNLGGTYRHYNFEKQMIVWLIDEVNTKTIYLIETISLRE